MNRTLERPTDNFRDAPLGRQTRAHADLEIAIPAAAFDVVRRYFPGLGVHAVGSGRMIWQDATDDQLAAVHQTWLREPTSGKYLLTWFPRSSCF